jgi:catechol 2,3-dioxygenase-like lactoylglutathione lyase family enzyme
MPTPLHGTTIDHVELLVPDRQAAAAWYQDVLGLTTVPGTEHWARESGGPLMISGDGGRVCLALFEGPPTDAPPQNGYRRVAFRVSGAEFVAFVEYGRKLGLTPMALQDHTTTISVYFRDPYGHDLEVTTWECEEARAVMGSAER